MENELFIMGRGLCAQLKLDYYGKKRMDSEALLADSAAKTKGKSAEGRLETALNERRIRSIPNLRSWFLMSSIYYYIKP